MWVQANSFQSRVFGSRLSLKLLNGMSITEITCPWFSIYSSCCICLCVCAHRIRSFSDIPSYSHTNRAGEMELPLPSPRFSIRDCPPEWAANVSEDGEICMSDDGMDTPTIAFVDNLPLADPGAEYRIEFEITKDTEGDEACCVGLCHWPVTVSPKYDGMGPSAWCMRTYNGGLYHGNLEGHVSRVHVGDRVLLVLSGGLLRFVLNGMEQDTHFSGIVRGRWWWV
jgi:hypothetical protein